MIGAYKYEININETHIGDVITLCFLVLKYLHQFCCSSYQKQGSPSTIRLFQPSRYDDNKSANNDSSCNYGDSVDELFADRLGIYQNPIYSAFWI